MPSSTPGPSTNTSTAVSTGQFSFPPIHSYPPFYSLQVNTSTLQSQLSTWSTIIRDYCRHQRLFRLSLSDQLDSALFYNRPLGKRLKEDDARRVLDFMREKQASAEPIAGGGGRGGGGGATAAAAAKRKADVWWIWWRKVDEWAGIIEAWVEEVGQKNTVLTLYELTQGDLTRGTEFHELDQEVLQKALAVLVKRGKAQVFGSEDRLGVKFFQ